MDPKEIGIWVIAVPVAISLVVMLASHLPWRRDRETQPWGPALAVAGAFATSFIGMRGWPRFPPGDAQTWLIFLGAGAVVIAIAGTFAAKRGRWIVATAGALLIVVTVGLLSRPRIPILGWQHFLIQAACIAAGFVAWWFFMDRLADRAKGATVPLVLMITASVAALAIVNAHSEFVGKLAGTSAAACGAMWVTAFYFRKQSIARGGVLALAVVLLGVILAAHHFANLSMLDLILLSVAPLMAWAGELPIVKGKKRRFMVRLVAVLIVLAIPLVPAAKGLRETLQQETDSYTY